MKVAPQNFRRDSEYAARMLMVMEISTVKKVTMTVFRKKIGKSVSKNSLL